jgi:ADP-ribose pyrophosphatase YjhB (NUDIX family)
VNGDGHSVEAPRVRFSCLGRRRQGAFALVWRPNKRLLIAHRRDLAMWDLPGGLVEPHEMPWETVAREVHEESRLRIHVCALAAVADRPDQDEIAYGFHASVGDGQEPEATAEAKEFCWISNLELPEAFHPEQRQVVEELGKFPMPERAVVVLTQRGPAPRTYWA